MKKLCGILILFTVFFTAGIHAEEAGAQAIGKAYDAQAQANLQALRSAIANFRQTQNRYPTSLQELVTSGLLQELPAAPPGRKFVYDAAKGTVTIAADPNAPPAPKLPDSTPGNAMAMALDMQAKANLKKIRTALNVYMIEHDGQFPAKLEELVKSGMLENIPPPPARMKYAYDPKTGKVDFAPK